MKVFISHSVRGDPSSEELARNLFEELKTHNFEPFLDLEGLRVGDDWEVTLRSEIERSDAAVLLVSRKALKESEWVAREIHLLQVRQGSRPGFLILPLFLGDVRPEEVNIDRLKHLDLATLQGLRVHDTPDWLERVLARLDGARRGVLDAYLDALEAVCDRLPYESIAYSRAFPPLSELYVPQVVEEQQPTPEARDVQESGQARAPSRQTRQPDELLRRSRNFVLEGGPGTGKSTLLRHLALKLIRQWRSGGPYDMLPVLVTARTLAPRKVSFSESLRLEVEESLGRLLEVPLPDDFFEHSPAPHAHWLVLVDALDEVLDPRERNALITDILSIAARGTAPYRFVASTRPIGRGLLLGKSDFQIHQLLPFSSKDIEAFAQKWFAAHLHNRAKEASAFLARIETSRLGDLVENPLLLTMAAVVYDHNAADSGGRVALYRKFVDTVLDRERQDRDARAQIRTQWEQAQGQDGLQMADRLFNGRREILQHLALYLRNGGVEPLAVEALRLSRERGWVPTDDDPEALSRLESLLSRTGLIDGHGDRQAFVHPTFADYLSAAVIDRQLRDQSRRIWDFVRRWKDETQREVVLFLLGIWTERGLDLDPPIRKIAESSKQGARFCGVAIAQGIGVSQEIEARVIRLLLDQMQERFWWLEPSRPSAAEVLGLMRGRHLVRTGLVALARNETEWAIVRNTAVDALARLGYMDCLRDLSSDPTISAGVRVRAVGQLGSKDLKLAEKSLEFFAMSSSTDGYDRLEATRTLNRLGFKRQAQSLALDFAMDQIFRENYNWRIGAAQLVGELGRREESLELLFYVLHDPDESGCQDNLDLDDLVSAFGDVGGIEDLLEKRTEAARPDRIATHAVRWLYNNGDDKRGSELLAEILRDARQVGMAFIRPTWIFPYTEDEESLSRIAEDEGVEDSFRKAAARYLEALSLRRLRLDRWVRGPVRRARWAIVRLLNRLLVLLKRFGFAVFGPLVRMAGRRRYVRHLTRVACSHVASDKQRLNAVDQIQELGDQGKWTECLRAVANDKTVWDLYRAYCASELFLLGLDEDVWRILTTCKSQAEVFFEGIAKTERMEAATALVVRLVHSESVSSDFQGHAIKSIRTSANSSLLESLARDPTLKRWLRVLAVRLLAESQDDAATSLSCDEGLDVEVRLEAVNHLGRTSYADALWSLACDCATNARVRRFAVWWLGHLSDDETDTRLQGLAETKPEARVLAAIEDARTLLAVRAAASAV